MTTSYRGNHSELNRSLVAAFGVGKVVLSGESQKQPDGSFAEVGTVTSLDAAITDAQLASIVTQHQTLDWPLHVTALKEIERLEREVGVPRWGRELYTKSGKPGTFKDQVDAADVAIEAERTKLFKVKV